MPDTLDFQLYFFFLTARPVRALEAGREQTKHACRGAALPGVVLWSRFQDQKQALCCMLSVLYINVVSATTTREATR